MALQLAAECSAFGTSLWLFTTDDILLGAKYKIDLFKNIVNCRND